MKFRKNMVGLEVLNKVSSLSSNKYCRLEKSIFNVTKGFFMLLNWLLYAAKQGTCEPLDKIIMGQEWIKLQTEMGNNDHKYREIDGEN